MIGFANKVNAKRTLDNNFTNNEDYRITILPSEKGQIAREDIMFLLIRTEKQKIKNNFTEGEDYKISFFRSENRKNKVEKIIKT